VSERALFQLLTRVAGHLANPFDFDDATGSLERNSSRMWPEEKTSVVTCGQNAGRGHGGASKDSWVGRAMALPKDGLSPMRVRGGF
jgi:hypothetical protein